MIRIDLGPRGLIGRFVCPRCGGGKFELVPVIGSSVCLNCRLPLATWAHEPQALNTRESSLDPMLFFRQSQFDCAFDCGARFANSAEGFIELAQHESLHVVLKDGEIPTSDKP